MGADIDWAFVRAPKAPPTATLQRPIPPSPGARGHLREGRGVSDLYGVRDAAHPIGTG